MLALQRDFAAAAPNPKWVSDLTLATAPRV
jgi:hypothetical protein